MSEYRKRLIEVAIPLEAVNDASAYDKMPAIGPHPKGMHHWWARLPLPSARAVLFASLVVDPSAGGAALGPRSRRERCSGRGGSTTCSTPMPAPPCLN